MIDSDHNKAGTFDIYVYVFVYIKSAGEAETQEVRASAMCMHWSPSAGVCCLFLAVC